MSYSVYDLRAFYTSRTGRVVRRVIRQKIHSFWTDTHGMRLMGCGYATPYLRGFMGGSERVFAMMPARMGVHQWPYHKDEKNLVCLAYDDELPIETSSIDRLLAVHDLEYAENAQTSLQEMWRVLKPDGRLLVIVPNRRGLWARTDWSPFGHGTPFSAAQICGYLRNSQFIHERTEETLFMPPLRFAPVLQSAMFFEKFGSFVPVGAGVHIIEATKQLFARVSDGGGAAVAIGTKRLIPKPVAAG